MNLDDKLCKDSVDTINIDDKLVTYCNRDGARCRYQDGRDLVLTEQDEHNRKYVSKPICYICSFK
jgi:hypothetical protein